MKNNNKELEEAIVATIKALAKTKEIGVSFNEEKIDFANINQNLAKNIFLPTILHQNDLQPTRYKADLAALYLKFHNSKIHQQNFENQQSQQLFDDFEKFRIIKLGSEEFMGIAVNLEPILIKNLEQIADYSFLPFLMLLDQQNFSNQLINKIKPYQKLIDRDLLNKINQLSNLTNRQEAFSIKVIELIEFLNNQSQQPTKKQAEKNTEKQRQTDEAIEQEMEVEKPTIATSKSMVKTTQTTENQLAEILETSDQQCFGETEIENQNQPKTNIKFVPEYKIFSKKFDQIIKASELASAKELANLRLQLEVKLAELKKTSKHLTAKLKRKLLAKKQISFQLNREEGLLDRKKMSQIIASPLSRNHYLKIEESEHQNTILSILLDNSGSMRGMPIIISAMASEIIAKIFEGFGIKTEILGFTTSDWRGGNSRKLWEQSGKPKNPGRLSDLRHIIYKNANQSFKKSKNNLALMLKDGMLKENIDGEALIWAATRLKSRNEKRKILLIISDGTPIDDSTNSNNDSDILNDHLHQSIRRLEKHSKIEIAAIGILHNVGDFYQNAITVHNIEELGNVMIEKICGMQIN